MLGRNVSPARWMLATKFSSHSRGLAVGLGGNIVFGFPQVRQKVQRLPLPPEEEHELSDEELAKAVEESQLCPASEQVTLEDFALEDQPLIQLPPLSPAEFTSFAFRMIRPDGLGYENFQFEGRRHMRQLYDTRAKRLLLKCGRQVEKSTLLGNSAIAHSCMVSGFRTLYVSPSATQTKTFSVDRIKEPLETSDILRSYTTTALQQNVFEKQFVNRSKITLRYAFLNADRVRGIPAWKLLIDELQDILSDNIPVIEQSTSHAPENWKSFIYAGTPKSLDNTLEYYWSGTARGRPMSTMGEWMVPCDRCGSAAGAGRYWNILGEKNIEKKGLSCERCRKLINPMHSDSQWAAQANDGIFESYRIPQLMVPWRSWDEIMLDYGRYDRQRFYNEVLGISYDSGLRPLTRAQVRACSNPEVHMDLESLKKYVTYGADNPIFCGVDWGCHDEETRILTESGFKYFRDLTDADKVAQWDPDSRAMTFVQPKARTVRDWDQPLLHFQTRGGVDLMVTHTHRMRISAAGRDQWVTESAGETAARGGNINFVGHINWEGREEESFTLPGMPVSSGFSGADPRTFKMDDWLELLGYLITEGGVCHNEGRPSCLKMSQRETVNHETYLKMQSCLDRMNIPFKVFPNMKTGDVNWTIYGKQFWQWYCENVGDGSSVKRVPRQFLDLSVRQLRILFAAMVDGDGYTDPREGCTGGAFYSTSRGLCEDFQEICIRLGLRCVVRLHKPAEGNRQTRYRALWLEGRDFQFNTPSSAVEHIPYKGKVYCCAVPSGYIVTERNGCVSFQGNTGENSFTVITFGTYINQKFRVFYIHRFQGEEVDPKIQILRIIELISYFNTRIIGADYGGGFYPNDELVRKFGPKRVHKYQYLARGKRKIGWNPMFRRWQCVRTEVMSDVFNAIKRQQFELPNWEEFEDPYANDMLNIYSEYNNKLRMLQYDHQVDRPDDAFHSILYCFLASMIVYPRPDIIAPYKEIPGQGPLRSFYRGPINQG